MRRGPITCLFTATLLIAGCHRQPAAGLNVTGAWVRLPAAGGRPGAAYFTVQGGAAADRLATVDSPSAERAELHEGGMVDGMMVMRPMSGVDVPGGGRVAFAPGGNHAMLFGINPALRSGGTLPLRFRFVSGATRTADAKIVAAGDPAPAPAP